MRNRKAVEHIVRKLVTVCTLLKTLTVHSLQRYAHYEPKGKIMFKVLSKNKINSILAECQTPTTKVISYTKNGEWCEATAQTVCNVLSDLDFSRAVGGKEQPMYALLPDGNVFIGVISTRPDGREQSRRCFIIRFKDNNFLN